MCVCVCVCVGGGGGRERESFAGRRGRLWVVAGPAVPDADRIVAAYASGADVARAAAAGGGGPAFPLEYAAHGAVVGCVRVTGVTAGGGGGGVAAAKQPVEAAAAWLWVCDEPETCVSAALRGAG